jgi:hypothetical protein
VQAVQRRVLETIGLGRLGQLGAPSANDIQVRLAEPAPSVVRT